MYIILNSVTIATVYIYNHIYIYVKKCNKWGGCVHKCRISNLPPLGRLFGAIHQSLAITVCLYSHHGTSMNQI